MQIELEKGHSSVVFEISEEIISGLLTGNNIVAASSDELAQKISQGLKRECTYCDANEKIAIIIPDNTRLWARGDIYVPVIVQSLQDLGISTDNIAILIALGTHSDIQPEQFSQLAGDYCTNAVRILNSANKNTNRLTYLGETSRKTPVSITSEAIEADRIIIFGGVLHHVVAGFGGGRKYIFPGIAGYDSIQKNHSLAMTANGQPHPGVGQARLSGNPVNEDIDEAVALFLQDKKCTYIGIVANGQGEIFHAEVGPLKTTFETCCERLNNVCSENISVLGDFALLSAGGHRTDGQLYQATKALFNGVEAVKEGGKILLVAACSEGGGNYVFTDVLKKYRLKNKELGRMLAQSFDMPSYVAFRVIDILNRYEIYLLSDYSKAETQELGFNYIDDFENYVNKLDGLGYIIPFAENILPVLKSAK